jgi:hypothetical protein
MAGETMKPVVATLIAVLAAAPAASLAAPQITTASLATEPIDTGDARGGQIRSTDARPHQPARRHAAAPAANPLWAIPLATLTETRERPLFSPSRRAPPPVPEHGAYSPPVRQPPRETPPERPQLSLVGTIVGRAAGFGLFVDPATKVVVRLKTGKAYRGWVLRTVREREVVLEKNHLSATITLPTPGQHQPVIRSGKGRGQDGNAVGPALHNR